MTYAVTNKDGIQIMSFSGAELGAHIINANTSCAIDYVWISDLENGLVPPDEQLKANENSLTDDVLSLLLDIQRTSAKINALRRLNAISERTEKQSAFVFYPTVGRLIRPGVTGPTGSIAVKGVS